MSKQYKIDVSEWRFILDDGTFYDLVDVEKETVVCSGIGKFSIALKVPTYHKEDWDNILDAGNLREIQQKFYPANELGEKLEEVKISYMDAKVASHKQESKNGEAATFSIVLKNNKKK